MSALASQPDRGACHLQQRRHPRCRRCPSSLRRSRRGPVVGATPPMTPAATTRSGMAAAHARVYGPPPDSPTTTILSMPSVSAMVRRSSANADDRVVLIRRRRPDAGPVDTDQPDVRAVRRRPGPPSGSAGGRPACRAARRWRGPADRRTRRTRSGGHRRRRCCLRAWDGRLRQPWQSVSRRVRRLHYTERNRYDPTVVMRSSFLRRA